MTIARVPFQPICESTDPRVPVNNNIGPLRMLDLKHLIISGLGIKALGKLCLASIHWNHLVANDRVWAPIAARLECPLQEGVPFYRQVVLFMQNVRDKLIFIDRCRYIEYSPVSFSPLTLLTQADLDNENEEKMPPDLDQARKRVRLENAQSEEETPTLRGLTVEQTRFLQNLKRARDMLEAWDFIQNNDDDVDGWEDVPHFNWDDIVDVQTIFAKAEQFSNWFKTIGNSSYFDQGLNELFVEPFTEEMKEHKEFWVEMLNDPAKRNAYFVAEYLQRRPEVAAPEWIKEYADVQTISHTSIASPKELAMFQQLRKISLEPTDNFVEVLEELDKLPNLDVLCLECVPSQLLGLPKENRFISRLQELSLRDGRLVEMPKEICRFTKLKKINLSHNNFDQLPAELSALTQLESLDLSHNRLTKLPGMIARLSSLRTLDIRSNRISALPVQICKLFATLEMLDLSHNQFNEEFYQSFSERIREVIRNGKLEGENLALFKEEALANFRKAISLPKNFIIKQ